jgi:hypothetical protein
MQRRVRPRLRRDRPVGRTGDRRRRAVAGPRLRRDRPRAGARGRWHRLLRHGHGLRQCLRERPGRGLRCVHPRRARRGATGRLRTASRADGARRHGADGSWLPGDARGGAAGRLGSRHPRRCGSGFRRGPAPGGRRPRRRTARVGAVRGRHPDGRPHRGARSARSRRRRRRDPPRVGGRRHAGQRHRPHSRPPGRRSRHRPAARQGRSRRRPPPSDR